MGTFYFKEFTIQQNQAAMKVGTDSILLGSWVAISSAVNSILDIGAGTGILALMMAQRSDAITVDAVEIEVAAYEEAVTNFENSPWGDRLFCYHSSLQDFAKEIGEKYDLIIANPPFFNPSKIKSVSKRSLARQMHRLNHIALLKNTKSLLSKTGSCAFVVPYESESFFMELAKSMDLFASRILHTKDTETAPIKRSFLQFKFEETACKTSTLVLKNKDASYSEAYVELTKDFYSAGI